MKSSLLSYIIIFFVALAAQLLAAEKQEECTPIKKKADLGRLPELVGKWEGTGKMNGKKHHMEVQYKLTSGGTALVETIMPGTPHEMVSVYTEDDGEIVMTHYCMIGNQPYLRQLESDSPDKIVLDYDGGGNMKSVKEPHMHALTITFLDKNRIRQEWAFYENGKQKQVEAFELKRKS